LNGELDGRAEQLVHALTVARSDPA
jgi:hypothetical protein